MVSKGELVPQAHGGALQRGGTGAGGRPRSEVRALVLDGARRAVPKLIEILEDPRSAKREVIAAARVLLEFGLGRHVELSTGENLHVEGTPPVRVPAVRTQATDVLVTSE